MLDDADGARRTARHLRHLLRAEPCQDAQEDDLGLRPWQSRDPGDRPVAIHLVKPLGSRAIEHAIARRVERHRPPPPPPPVVEGAPARDREREAAERHVVAAKRRSAADDLDPDLGCDVLRDVGAGHCAQVADEIRVQRREARIDELGKRRLPTRHARSGRVATTHASPDPRAPDFLRSITTPPLDGDQALPFPLPLSASPALPLPLAAAPAFPFPLPLSAPPAFPFPLPLSGSPPVVVVFVAPRPGLVFVLVGGLAPPPFRFVPSPLVAPLALPLPAAEPPAFVWPGAKPDLPFVAPPDAPPRPPLPLPFVPAVPDLPAPPPVFPGGPLAAP